MQISTHCKSLAGIGRNSYFSGNYFKRTLPRFSYSNRLLKNRLSSSQFAITIPVKKSSYIILISGTGREVTNGNF